jgi:hypothetical protein
MLKRILITFLILPVIGGAIYGYFYFKQVKTPLVSVFKAIPTNAVLVSEAVDFSKTWRSFSSDNSIWKALLSIKGIQEVNTHLQVFDSILVKGKKELDLDEEQPVFFSVHPDSLKGMEFLVAFNIPNTIDKKAVDQLITNAAMPGFTRDSRMVQGIQIQSLNWLNGKSIHFYQSKGIFAFSFSFSLIEQSASLLSSPKSLLDDKSFSTVYKTSGHEREVNVLLNFSNLSKVIPDYLNPENTVFIRSLASFGGWISMDMVIQNDKVLMNGFTISNESEKDFLSVFKNQQPVKIDATSVIPSNAAYFTYYGISNLSEYLKSYNAYQMRISEDSLPLNKESDKVSEQQAFFKSWFNNEAVTWWEEPMSNEEPLKHFAAFSFKDSTLVNRAFDNLEQNYVVNAGFNPDSLSEIYRGFKFRTLPESNLVSNVWGSSFPAAGFYYYTITAKYVVFSDSPEALRSWVNFYLAGRVLASNKKYNGIASDLSEKTNFYVYSALARSAAFIKKEVNPQLAKSITMHEPILRKFQSLSVQFSNNGKLFYNNLCLKFDPEYEPEFNALWEFGLDTFAFGEPWPYFNPADSTTGFILQDVTGKLYRINEKGELQWKIQLPELVYGHVTQVGPFRENEWNLMLAGKKTLYRITSDGKFVDGFPVDINLNLTCPLGIYDFEKDGNPLILAAINELRIVRLNADGRKDNSWRTESLKDTLLQGFEFFKVNGRKVVFFIDRSGWVKLIDKEGNWVEKLKSPVEDYDPQRFTFIKAGDISRCRMWFVNGLGELMEMDFKGKVKKRSLPQSWSGNNLRFVAGNLMKDKHPEFVFTFNNQLRVFSHQFEICFEKKFRDPIVGLPQLIQINDSSSRVVLRTSGLSGLHILNKAGKLNFETPLQGSLPVRVLSVEGGKFSFLVSAHGKKVSAFAVQHERNTDDEDREAPETDPDWVLNRE